jgi:hypothetical protein
MEFSPITLQTLLSEIGELPAGALDPKGQQVLLSVHECIVHFKNLNRPVTEEDLVDAFSRFANFIDVARLFFGISQDSFVNNITQQLPLASDKKTTWQGVSAIGRKNPAQLAMILSRLGLLDTINSELMKEWTLEDVLRERYKMLRGRAIAGQSRGRSLEDEIENGLKVVLNGQPIPYAKKRDFVGFQEKTAKCDFAIPSLKKPKIVIEAKAYEATGSKQTDVLGDVMKIIEAKSPHTYFFMVTDGRGWFRRDSDLKKLVEFHTDGRIDMIFTRSRMAEMNEAIKNIYFAEILPYGIQDR